MYKASDAYKIAITGSSRYISWRGTATDKNGKTYDITTSNMADSGITITKQICANSSLEIGTAYIGEMILRVWLDADRYVFFGGSAYMEFGLKVDDAGTMEWIPCGTYRIDQATMTDGLLELTCYDHMADFTSKLSITLITETPYEILIRLCLEHSITPGFTRSEIESMSNGKFSVSLWDSGNTSTIYTEQQIIGYICQALSAYAYIGMDDKLYIKQYGDTAQITVDEGGRFSFTVSDYETKYSSLTYGMMSDRSTHMLGTYDDLTMSLGENPMLQSADETTMNMYYGNILSEIKKISFTPFNATLPLDMTVEVGDIISFTGGEAEDGKLAPITSVTYNASGTMAVKCDGQNPRLQSRVKSDSTIDSLAQSVEEKTIYYYNYNSDDEIDVNDGISKVIFDIMFAQVSTNQITLQGEVVANTETTETETDDEWEEKDLEVRLTYTMNGELIEEHIPVWRTVGGRDVFSFYYPFIVSGGTNNRMVGRITADGGAVRIPAHGIYATIWGQGLYAKFANTVPLFEDTVSTLSMDATHAVVNAVADSATDKLVDVSKAAASASLGILSMDKLTATIEGITESVTATTKESD